MKDNSSWIDLRRCEAYAQSDQTGSVVSAAVLDVVLDIWRAFAIASLITWMDGLQVRELRLPLSPRSHHRPERLSDFSYAQSRWTALQVLHGEGVIENCELRRGRNPRFDQIRVWAIPMRVRAYLDEINSKLPIYTSSSELSS